MTCQEKVVATITAQLSKYEVILSNKYMRESLLLRPTANKDPRPSAVKPFRRGLAGFYITPNVAMRIHLGYKMVRRSPLSEVVVPLFRDPRRNHPFLPHEQARADCLGKDCRYGFS